MKLGFTQSNVDPNLYFKVDKEKPLILVEAKMDGMKKGVEANLDGLKKGMEFKMDGLKNGMEANMDDMEANMEDMKNDLKADMEGLKECLRKLIQEIIPKNKINVNLYFINFNV